METPTHATHPLAGAAGAALGADLLAVSQPSDDTLVLSVAAPAVRAATRWLAEQLGARFLVSVGIDRRPLSGDFAVLQLFSLDARHLFVVLECGLPDAVPALESITPIIPGAGWTERECRDAVGIEPLGHPDPRRLLLADDWPPGVFPLRRDVPYDFHPPPADGVRPALAPAPPGASVVAMGPFFPVLEEPAFFRLFVEGETVVGCDYRGFYNHRAIEKLGDSTLTYNEIPYLAERICGICGFIHSSCYCQAVEKAAGIAVPPRGRYIRTIMLELERIHSHLLWLGIAGHILGFDTVLMQTWRMREPVMWLAEALSGNRKTYGMNTIGGVRRDIPESRRPEILAVLDPLERELHALLNAIAGDSTLHARTQGVGVLTGEQVRAVCVVGPPARASAVAIDARIDHPYAAYDEIAPRLCSNGGGDVWARVLVRLDEVFDAIRIVREALDRLPGGAILAEPTEPIPSGRIGISVVEAPRGEAVHYVLTGDENRPYRWRVRAPTYPNLQAVPAMIANQPLADVPIALGSLDPCFSCTERMEALDLATGEVRVYSRDDLLHLSRRRAGKEARR